MSQHAGVKAVGVVVGLLLGTALIGCSADRAPTGQPTVGEVSMALRLSSQVEAISIGYKISGGTLPAPITGTVDVSDPGATTSFFVGGIPAGPGYVIDVSAKSTDGKTTCAGSTTISIDAGTTTLVSLLLQCRADTVAGNVAVTGGTNNCPVIQSFSAGPQSTRVGGMISVSAMAWDLDAADVVTLSWSSESGAVIPTNSGTAKFICTNPGGKALTVTASDGKCSTSAAVDVTCVNPFCGNGVVDLDHGEQCEPGLFTGRSCTDNCIFISHCGDGLKETGEDCDPPNAVTGGANTCSAVCTNIPVVCGNGLIQPGEQCDPPQSAVPGGRCSSSCQLPRIPGPCGDHVVDIGEECDDGPGGSSICTTTCKRIPDEGCETCEASRCNAQIDGCNLYSGNRRTLCEDWVNCVRGTKGNNCSAVGKSPHLCVCGNASDAVCVAGDGDGLCKAEAEAAAEAGPCGTNETAQACKNRRGIEVAERFRDPTYPIGGGTNLLLCDAERCVGQCFL